MLERAGVAASGILQARMKTRGVRAELRFPRDNREFSITAEDSLGESLRPIEHLIGVQHLKSDRLTQAALNSRQKESSGTQKPRMGPARSRTR